MGVISSVGSSIGYDHGSAVSTQYQSPFAFAGTLQQIEIELLSRQSIEAARAQAQAEMSRQ
jgi:arylsulfatase